MPTNRAEPMQRQFLSMWTGGRAWLFSISSQQCDACTQNSRLISRNVVRITEPPHPHARSGLPCVLAACARGAVRESEKKRMRWRLLPEKELEFIFPDNWRRRLKSLLILRPINVTPPQSWYHRYRWIFSTFNIISFPSPYAVGQSHLLFRPCLGIHVNEKVRVNCSVP